MIAIVRVTAPPEFSAKGAVAMQEVLESIRAGVDARRLRDIVVRRQSTLQMVRQALKQMFHRKCAYCESRYGTTSPVDIEPYLPKGGVKKQMGTTHCTMPGWRSSGTISRTCRGLFCGLDRRLLA